MNTGKGIGGREVPGAAFVDNGKSDTRRKKRKGRKGRQAAVDAGEALQESAEERNGLLEETVGDAGSARQDIGVVEDGIAENGAGANGLLDTNAPTLCAVDGDDAPREDPGEGIIKDSVPEKATRELERREIENWLDNQTYNNLSRDRRSKIIEHLTKSKYPQHDLDWATSTRLMIWRAVVRANYWWINPETGEPTGKPKPVRIPDGYHESNFEVFVMCCAEKEDRMGRDLPDPEYVRQVQMEVRQFMKTAEKERMQDRLKHLAFLLMFDEENKRHNILKLEEMQERIRRAFSDANVDWSGSEIFKASSEQQQALAPDAGLVVADNIWHDAMAQL